MAVTTWRVRGDQADSPFRRALATAKATPWTAGRTDTPDRWEYSVARSMSVRMRSRSRDASRAASGSSSNFVTQSTLRRGDAEVKARGIYFSERGALAQRLRSVLTGPAIWPAIEP